ncbi:MAG: phospho-N-acetylmuramoyl-pentapeptide-transferase [Prochloraceae cyanobacterium]|nr:phospho-N-acetylmuramoyl-pentapeptide-transferase [Prochloraceae cyanobacterium]
MDAKLFSSSALKNPSGNSLLIFLAALLVIVAVVLGLDPSLLIPLFVCLLLSGGLGYGVVPILQRFKAGQVIREDGPASHLKKAGTPTMGGIFFVPVAILVSLVWSGFSSNAIALAAVTLAYGAIGWFDDWQILRLKSNQGLSPKMKLALQIAIATLFSVWVACFRPQELTNITFFGDLILPLGLFFWPLAIFAMVAESNATNLTDGVDGLASGTAAIAFLGLGIIVAPTAIDLAIFCVCFSGSCFGFLLHNRNPASVFMGDTGSLTLGAALAAAGILGGSIWPLFIVSGIFFIESISVIAQVTYYKATKGPDGKGKRLFKMAPIHHHLELSGWSETQIVGVFYLSNAILAICAFLLS